MCPYLHITESARPQINDQVLFDFKNDNLSNVRDGERSIYYNGQGTVKPKVLTQIFYFGTLYNIILLFFYIPVE